TNPVSADGSTANGIDTEVGTHSLTITVNPLSDPPVGSSAPSASVLFSTFGNPTHIFTKAEFGFTDPGDNPADNFVSINISAVNNNPASTPGGTFFDGNTTIDAAAIAAAGGVYKVNVATSLIPGAETFKYIAPATGTQGNESMTYKLQDSGNLP